MYCSISGGILHHFFVKNLYEMTPCGCDILTTGAGKLPTGLTEAAPFLTIDICDYRDVSKLT
jgi:hypothetical protein